MKAFFWVLGISRLVFLHTTFFLVQRRGGAWFFSLWWTREPLLCWGQPWQNTAVWGGPPATGGEGSVPGLWAPLQHILARAHHPIPCAYPLQASHCSWAEGQEFSEQWPTGKYLPEMLGPGRDVERAPSSNMRNTPGLRPVGDTRASYGIALKLSFSQWKMRNQIAG